ncbi:MAG: hypothetical protein HN975_19330 [Anaerolineae bacterium]|jgi:hypothetical protein|nr:hypothetical protein [Anaerolineae bacterium]MBT7988459.1 hypothetical protein [Anaerolineae bacterium]
MKENEAKACQKDWTNEARYRAYGICVELRSSQSALLDAAAAHLPLGWHPLPETGARPEVTFVYRLHQSTEPNKEYRLYYNDKLLSQSANLPEVLTTLENHAELYTAYHAKDYLFIHAGVVAWKGEIILIPGRSMSGKTTLTHALLHAGATYYSDEFALLDAEGLVHPYPVPLSIRKGGAIVGEKHPLEKLGIQAGTDPLPLGLIVVAKYQRYARWQPKILPPAEAMLALMDNAVAARGEPAFSMPILKKVAMGAKTIASKRGEAKRVARAILEEMR